MRTWTRRLALGVVSLGLAGAFAGDGRIAAADAAKAPCCFTNPRYAGVCSVAPGEGETCQSVLDYLNNPQSQGKSYCGNTNVRGGWQQTACQK